MLYPVLYNVLVSHPIMADVGCDMDQSEEDSDHEDHVEHPAEGASGTPAASPPSCGTPQSGGSSSDSSGLGIRASTRCLWPETQA